MATPWSAVAPSLILKESGLRTGRRIENIRVHVRTCAPSWSLMRANPSTSDGVRAGYCLELPISQLAFLRMRLPARPLPGRTGLNTPELDPQALDLRL